MTVNRGASIRARLKQYTDTSKQDFNLTLTRYGLERRLYRLSISELTPNVLPIGRAAVPTLVRPAAPADTRRRPARSGFRV